MKNTKKALLLILIFINVSLSGCLKDTVNISKIEQLSLATQQSLKSNTIIELKQSYGLLSIQERQQLWNLKLNSILINDANNLTQEQIRIVRIIKDFGDKKTITELLKNLSDGVDFIRKNKVYFESHFNNAQLYLLIECAYFCDGFSITKSDEYLSKIGKQKKSKYLSNLSELEDEFAAEPKCTCYYSWYCSASTSGGICNDGGCKLVDGCGFWGTSNCTGRCS